MHQCACSSSATGNGSDLGIRQQWLPLFDRYQVDLVLNGHDHDYERSFPVRGADANAGREVATGAVVNTLRPHPVTTTDNGVFDTSQGTVHLILGCGGTDANLDDYGTDAADGQPQAKVFTTANRPVPTSTPDVFTRAAADAVEDAIWSAKRDTSTGYGIAVFDVDPGPGGVQWSHQHHRHPVPRGGRRPGQPRHRRQGRADPGLHRVRDLHPGPPALGSTAGARAGLLGWHGVGRGQRVVDARIERAAASSISLDCASVSSATVCLPLVSLRQRIRSGMDVLVIGAGVSGLTTGIRLAEAGLDVTIRAAAPPSKPRRWRPGRSGA